MIIVILLILIIFIIVITSLFRFGFRYIKDTDKKQKIYSRTIRTLTSEAEHLMDSVDIPEIKDQATVVYKAIRYSDPVSTASSEELDTRMQRQFASFKNAAIEGDAELAAYSAQELLLLIDERNKACRLTKN